MNPTEIIIIFDEILDATFGRENGRDYPAKEDIALAQKWIDKGMTAEIARSTFTMQFEKLRLKWMERARPTDRSLIPHGLKFIAEDVDLILMNPDRFVDKQNDRYSQWRARVRYWNLKRSWYEDLFGPPPDNPLTKVPKCVLTEFGIQEKKTAMPIK